VGRTGPTFTNDVHRLTVAKTIDADPRFNRDGIAVGEIERAFRAGVFESEPASLTVEADRLVVGGEIRKLRRRRPRFIAHDDAVRYELRRFLRVKIPPRDQC